MPLTDTFVRSVKHSGRGAGDKHSDAGGLYLLVTGTAKLWRLNYRYLGKQKTLAIGPYPEITLAQARRTRDLAKEQLAANFDPGALKRQEKQARVLALASNFESVARDWLRKTSADRAAITQEKITAWLEKDVFPHIGDRVIATLKPRDILAVLRKVEARNAIDSAHRIRGLVGQIFRYGVAIGIAERDVTVDLRGALQTAKQQHHPAITEPVEVGALMRAIYAYKGHPYTVAALKLAPLVFVRPGELRGAEWHEFDLKAAEWRIPATRMKIKVDHIVPLSTQVVAILNDLHNMTGHGRYVFPSLRTGERPMSENTLNAALRGMGYDQETHVAHGFRATARTIMDEVLGMRVDLIEHQLAHAVKDPNGRAYNRTAHLAARREMMQQWSDYLDKLRIGADVIPLRATSNQ